MHFFITHGIRLYLNFTFFTKSSICVSSRCLFQLCTKLINLEKCRDSVLWHLTSTTWEMQWLCTGNVFHGVPTSGQLVKVPRFCLAVKHSRGTHFITMTEVRLEVALTRFIPGCTNILMWRAYAPLFHRCFPRHSPTHIESIKCLWPHVSGVTFRLYSLLRHVNCPYQLSTSQAFMWLRWLNKNAVRGADPDLWLHRNIHTNVKPITSFLLTQA